MPWIKPYYAIKSNPSIEIINTLLDKKMKTNNAVGLDAASINELKISLSHSVSNNIIYTNPHTISHEKDILSEMLQKVDLKVVDSMCELKKMIKYNIQANLLVRLISNVCLANCQFDSKFGCNIQEAFEIIKYAKKHNIKVKGVSFHIGSGGNFKRKDAYKTAIEYAKPVLNYLEKELNNEKPILDIGGGVLYNTDLEDALGWTKHLPYKIISELGRYYSEPSYHLAVQIIAETDRGIFLDNGVYHELNVYHRDHWDFPKLTHYYDTKNGKIEEVKEFKKVKIFGPTCDSYDTINECIFPSSYNIEDWIFLKNMGSYTSAGKVDFNGIRGAST